MSVDGFYLELLVGATIPAVITDRQTLVAADYTGLFE